MIPEGGGWSVVPNWVIRSTTLHGTEKLMYIALLNRANKAGECWPSLDLLEADVGVSRKTVLRNLERLEELNLVERVRRRGPDGGNTSNLYRVNVWEGDAGASVKTTPPSGNENLPPVAQLHPPSGNENLEERPSETNTGETGSSAVADTRPEVEALLDLLDSELTRNGVTKLPVRSKKNRDAVRLMLDRDGRTVDQVRAAILWCQNDEFWRGNIMSATKLREQYERLQLEAKRQQQAMRQQVGPQGRESPGDKARRLAAEVRAGKTMPGQIGGAQ